MPIYFLLYMTVNDILVIRRCRNTYYGGCIMGRIIAKKVLKDGCPLGELEGYEETDSIEIDFSSIPDHVKEDLAASTLESVNAFLRQPGGREFLDKKKALKKQK